MCLPLLQLNTRTHTPMRTLHHMACADGALCKRQSVLLDSPEGHGWRGMYLTLSYSSDDKQELNGTEHATSAGLGGGGGDGTAAILGAIVVCSPLEQCAEWCGMGEAGQYLRKVKMSFIAAHAAKPTRQARRRKLSVASSHSVWGHLTRPPTPRPPRQSSLWILLRHAGEAIFFVVDHSSIFSHFMRAW